MTVMNVGLNDFDATQNKQTQPKPNQNQNQTKLNQPNQTKPQNQPDPNQIQNPKQNKTNNSLDYIRAQQKPLFTCVQMLHCAFDLRLWQYRKHWTTCSSEKKENKKSMLKWNVSPEWTEVFLSRAASVSVCSSGNGRRVWWACMPGGRSGWKVSSFTWSKVEYLDLSVMTSSRWALNSLREAWGKPQDSHSPSYHPHTFKHTL